MYKCFGIYCICIGAYGLPMHAESYSAKKSNWGYSTIMEITSQIRGKM